MYKCNIDFVFSDMIGQLEGTNLQKTQLIKQLEDEVNKLKDRLSWLESERKSLESQKNSLTSEQNSQLKSLERVSLLKLLGCSIFYTWQFSRIFYFK